MKLAIPLWLCRLQPDFIANAYEFSKRSDIEGCFPQQNLQVSTAHIVNVIGSLKKSVQHVFGHFSRLQSTNLAHTYPIALAKGGQP